MLFQNPRVLLLVCPAAGKTKLGGVLCGTGCVLIPRQKQAIHLYEPLLCSRLIFVCDKAC